MNDPLGDIRMRRYFILLCLIVVSIASGHQDDTALDTTSREGKCKSIYTKFIIQGVFSAPILTFSHSENCYGKPIRCGIWWFERIKRQQKSGGDKFISRTCYFLPHFTFWPQFSNSKKICCVKFDEIAL